jgi:hypothetical protein
MPRALVFEWCQRYSEGPQPESESQPGYLISKLVENTKIVRTLKRNDGFLSLRTIAILIKEL